MGQDQIEIARIVKARIIAKLSLQIEKYLGFLTGDMEADMELTIPVSDEEDDDGLPSDPDTRSTSILTREAATSAGISRKRGRPMKESEPNVRQKAQKKAPGGELQTFRK